MSKSSWQGVFTALVTPFQSNGSLDEPALERAIVRQLEAGIDGLVPAGSTGEAATLEEREWERVIEITVRMTEQRVPVIAGTGTNSTQSTIARTRRARELGANGALVVSPYYNKPNPSGLKAHYLAVAEQGGLPVVLYNVPGRTAQNLMPEQILEIAQDARIVAVKEASGVLGQAIGLIANRRVDLAVLSGEDELTVPMCLMGGDGVISVVSNVDPAGTVRMVHAALKGDVATAREHHYRQLPLMRALFAESNPVPCKAVFERWGWGTSFVRAPLAPASPATRELLAGALERAGLS